MAAQVGVVVPTFNRPVELAQCVRSVLGQVDVDLEIVIVDDGDSRGGLGPVFEDPRIRAIVTPYRAAGPTVARNAGLASITSPWVAFCDDDDLWHPRKLATQLAAAGDVAWMGCASAAFWVTRTGRPIVCGVTPPVEELPARLHRQGGFPGGASGVMARTELVRAAGGYRNLSIGEDWDLWLRLADRAPFGVVPERLVAIRVHPRSVTADVHRLIRGVHDIAALHTGSDGSQRVVPDVENHLRWCAQVASRSGQRRLAMSLQSAAAKYSGRTRDRVLALGLFAAPRTVERARAFRRRMAIPVQERRAIERWVRDALRPEPRSAPSNAG
jgi:glycosyltransferase involved in cell wall biosynthesis